MTLVLSSDNGYKGSETHIKRDPENRVPLIAVSSIIGGDALKGYVFRERLKAIRIRATLQGIFAGRRCETDRRPKHAIFVRRCNVRIDQFAPDDYHRSLGHLKCLGSI